MIAVSPGAHATPSILRPEPIVPRHRAGTTPESRNASEDARSRREALIDNPAYLAYRSRIRNAALPLGEKQRLLKQLIFIFRHTSDEAERGALLRKLDMTIHLREQIVRRNENPRERAARLAYDNSAFDREAARLEAGARQDAESGTEQARLARETRASVARSHSDG